jgi:hypothetical protein
MSSNPAIKSQTQGPVFSHKQFHVKILRSQIPDCALNGKDKDVKEHNAYTWLVGGDMQFLF